MSTRRLALFSKGWLEEFSLFSIILMQDRLDLCALNYCKRCENIANCLYIVCIWP